MEKFNPESTIEQLPIENFSNAIKKDLSDDIEIQKPKKRGKFLKALSMSVAATTLGLIINHVYQHRNKVEQHGENFTHSDPETEHILNLLCGKESFTEREKLLICKQITEKACQEVNISIPENMDTWSMTEFIEFNKKNKKPGLISDSQMEIFQEVISSNFFMKNLHDVLWKFEKDYGSPNIRWFIEGRHRASYYNSITNTINLAADTMALDFSEDFIAEMAHAKQFHEKPVSSYITVTIDYAKTLYTSITSNTSFSEEYLKLYDQEGTVEHEAHEIIEKLLEKEAFKAAAKDYEEEYERTHKKEGGK